MRKFWIPIAAVVLFMALAIPAFAGPFSDVPTDHWAWRAVKHLQEEGMVIGFPDGTFKGDNLFTRYEMAMVIARMYDQFMEKVADVEAKIPTGTSGITQEQLDSYKADMQEILDGFKEELEMRGYDIDDMKDWMWNIEDRVAALEKRSQAVTIDGVLRFRIEDIITNEYVGPYGSPFIGGTPGSNPGESFKANQMVKIAFSAEPAEFLKTYIDLWQIRDYLSTGAGIGGPWMEKDNGWLAVDQAYVMADLYKILGWEPGSLFNHFTIGVGRMYDVYGTYGMIFDNKYRTRPGLVFNFGGDRLDLRAFAARSVRNSIQEGLAVGRVAYGFGDPKGERNKTNYFAKVGVNLLPEGYGDEDGIGVDVDSQILDGDYINRIKVEFVYMQKDQDGFSVKDTYGTNYSNSLIAGVDLFNDGNTRVNVQYADVGLLPGFTSADLNPFENYDAYMGLIGGNTTLSYEDGLNLFPINFVGGAAVLEHTWFDTLYTKLFFYDGKTQSSTALPVLIRLHLKYPLSDKADIILDYIHSGIDAPTLAKLRGTYLVSF